MANILIIDDDKEIREMLLVMLGFGGHDAVAATNGLDGIRHFRTKPADLIITDMMMPYGGLATIRILRGEYPDVGVIAMSGGGKFRLDYARGIGVHTTLSKPFTADQLNAAVSKEMESRPKLDPAP